MIRYRLPFVLLIAALLGCSASQYKSLADFGKAVRQMNLLNLPLVDAHKRVQNEGFTCASQPQRVPNKPNIVELRCHRKVESAACVQHQYIYLHHPRDKADISDAVVTINGCLS